MIRKVLCAAMMAAAMGAGMSLPANAARDVTVRVAPPPERNEIAPAPRRGYVWVPGHWDWRNDRHVWVRGSWVRDRPGHRYRAPRWVERDGRWHLERGRWARGDRDGDGVPNRLDRRPNNPNRS